jgi:hypothetical protein
VARMTNLQQDMTAAFWEEKIVFNVKFVTEECWNKYLQAFLLQLSVKMFSLLRRRR